MLMPLFIAEVPSVEQAVKFDVNGCSHKHTHNDIRTTIAMIILLLKDLIQLQINTNIALESGGICFCCAFWGIVVAYTEQRARDSISKL